MKLIKYFVIMYITLLTLFHFSPHSINAAEDQSPPSDQSAISDENGQESADPVEETEEEKRSSDPAEELTTEEKETLDDGSESEIPDSQEEGQNEESKEETQEVNEESNPPKPKNNRSTNEAEKITTFSTQSSGIYKQADRHKDIAEFKKKLNAIGFDGILVTEYFGNFTEKRVRQFQANYGLQVDGIVGKQTLTKLDEVFNSPYQKGGSDVGINSMKKTLNHMGFGTITVTNYYGNFSKAKVQEFQRFIGLKDNGIADAYTRQKLDEFAASGFKQGDRHRKVSEFKKKLNARGFGRIKVTNYFGNYTEKKVKEFQRAYGLDVTGHVNAATLSKLDKTASASFQQGDNHQKIAEFKTKLNAIGFDGILVTEYFGGFTRKRVKEFQGNYGLPVTGKMNEHDLNKLGEVYNSPYQKGGRDAGIAPMKEKLNRMGFDGILVTNYFGNFTEKRVREFQRFTGLKDNGIADAYTRQKLDDFVANGFKQGNRHSEISGFKKKLNALGFGNILVTNYFGNFTKQRISEFQNHYELNVTGKANDVTLQKIDKIYNSPLQKGNRHEDIIKLKQDLNALGYDGIKVTNFFGSWTEKRLKQFQKGNDLPVNGIADDVTLIKMEQLTSHNESSHTFTDYNITLDQALNMQMKIKNPPPQTDKYRYEPAYIYSELVNVDKVVISGSIVNLRTAPGFGENVSVPTQVTKGTKVEYMETVIGDVHAGSNIWYKIKHKKKDLYVHSSLAALQGKVTPDTLNVRAEPSLNKSTHIYGQIHRGTIVDIVEQGSTWHKINYKANWRNAKSEDVKSYLDPSNFLEDSVAKFQFLDLSYKNDHATVSTLNQLLEGKGVLQGKGQQFISAGKKHGVNPMYLVSHALLETSNGTSPLAEGIKVNGTTVHNLYGIGAVDGCAESCGSKRAAEEDWTTVDKAIIGGARFIGSGYIQAGQNTLYKMRWNPEAMERDGVASHQYATDIGWAFKQLPNIYELYQQLDYYKLYLDIPRYK